MKFCALIILCIGLLLLAACSTPATGEPTQPQPIDEAPAESTELPAATAMPIAPEDSSPQVDEPSASFELTSTAFSYGEPIPVKYSCDGEEISPPLAWGNPPEGTQSLALIMDDPDAPVGTWDHWILFNIPTNTYGLEENLPITGANQNPELISVAKNSWGRNDYGGPCPPGGTHRYFFKLYALDTTLSLDQNTDKNQVLSAMDGHVLVESELMGTFSR